MIGDNEVPLMTEVNGPMYRPPLIQIVSPGRNVDGWVNAWARLHGALSEPSPDAFPSGLTQYSAPTHLSDPDKKIEITISIQRLRSFITRETLVLKRAFGKHLRPQNTETG